MHVVIYLYLWNSIHNILLNLKNKPTQGTTMGPILYNIERIHIQLNIERKISRLTIAILGVNFSLFAYLYLNIYKINLYYLCNQKQRKGCL